MRKIQNILILSVLLAVLTNCGKDNEGTKDVTAPTVSNVTLNELSSGATVSPGEELHLDAIFSDDQALGEYKIDIHSNFDGHSHGKLVATPFTYTESFEMTGRSSDEHQHIEIPADAATGPYDMILQYFDAAGNEGAFVEQSFEITDASQPVINVTSHDLTEEIELTIPTSLVLEGSIEDSDGLEEVHISITEEGANEPFFEQEYEAAGITSWDFSNLGAIPVSEGVPTGHYDLRIMAEDVEGNVKVVMGEIHIE